MFRVLLFTVKTILEGYFNFKLILWVVYGMHNIFWDYKFQWPQVVWTYTSVMQSVYSVFPTCLENNSNIKQFEEIRKLTTVQGEDYATGCLLHYEYIKNYYRLNSGWFK